MQTIRILCKILPAPTVIDSFSGRPGAPRLFRRGAGMIIICEFKDKCKRDFVHPNFSRDAMNDKTGKNYLVTPPSRS